MRTTSMITAFALILSWSCDQAFSQATYVVESPKTRATLQEDATHGVQLRTIENPLTGAAVTNDVTLAPSLFEIVLYDTRNPGVPIVVNAGTPRRAFYEFSWHGIQFFKWCDIELPGSSETIDVLVTVTAPREGSALEFATRWYLDVFNGCFFGNELRTYRVNFPIVSVDPIDQGILTADLLAGTATPQMVFPFTLLLDQLGSQRYESVHPGKGDPNNFLQPLQAPKTYQDLHAPGTSGRQTFQFSNLRFYPYPGVPSTSPLAQEILWMGSTDTEGYFKTYNLESVAEALPIPHAAIRWSVGHFAPMDPDPRAFFTPPQIQPYSVVLGLKPYQGPEWWFDVVEPYRDWVKRYRMVDLGPIERNPIFQTSSWDENAIYQGTVSYFMQNLPASAWPPGFAQDHLDASVQLAKDYKAAFDAPMNLQWQFTGEQPIETTTANTPPVFAGLRDAIARVHNEIVDAAVAYYQRFDLPVDEPAPEIDAERRYDYGVYDLQGNLKVRPKNGYPQTNFGSDEARDILMERTTIPFARDIGASGAYIDVLSGTGPTMSYGNWTAETKYNAHYPGGGAYWERGKRTYLARVQSALRSFQPNRPVFAISESVEETLAGWVDGMGQQVLRTPFVDHRLFLPPLPLGTAEMELDVPLMPPLWNSIYHEYQPTAALTMLHTVDWLISTGGVYTDDQFLELALYTHMMEFITGNNPFTFLVTTEGATGVIPGFGQSLFSVDSTGNLQPNDPGGAGLVFIQKMQELWRARGAAVCGPWMVSGRMERPMPVVRFRTQFHPLALLTLKDLTPEGPLLSYVRNIYPPAAYALFPALTTYHSVWSAPASPTHCERKLLAVVNWSNQPSDYALRFDPTDYFGPEAGPVDISPIDLGTGGLDAPYATNIQSTTVLDFGGNYAGIGPVAALPPVPPRTVMLLDIQE
ncbi:MAG: hypothetical protein H6834_14380 [Planctomycetes bacterium]|nr:hypothetical protein [Planctomycetota bacterium]MCB9891930.1 hypothetical protein [Planctomycetota bacterium]